MKISVIHATRRPYAALKMRQLWTEAASGEIEFDWTFGVDDDDPESLKALWPRNISGSGGGCIRAYNETANATDGDVIVCASDDVYPIKNWDKLIVERIDDISKPRFLACSDGRPETTATPLQIVTRAWVNHYGYIFHPKFKSMFGDNWIAERARRDGYYISAMDLGFEHRHPCLGTAEMDAVYEGENAADRYTDGRAVFDELLPPLKISLCMICGNEEAIILRCLESAKCAFDELCLMSAVGNRLEDKTLYRAEKWCAENGKSFKGSHYQNTHDLPHVDDFGAARNASFSMATGDWIFWLDCDDYLDEINARRVREAVAMCPPHVNGIYAKYSIEKKGAEIIRERLIRRGFGRWRNPIHETCEVKGQTVQCPQIVVFHSDHKHKHESSASRNSVILRRTIEDAPRHYFYLHTELKTLKDPEALKYGRIALELLSNNQDEERYVVLLNLSELEPEKRNEHLHAAAKIQPHRREAWAYLCQSALIDGRVSDAISYFRIMDSLPLPEPVPWTHQGIWYGWARNDLRVKCLRSSGKEDQANADHAKYMEDPEYAEGVKLYGND